MRPIPDDLDVVPDRVSTQTLRLDVVLVNFNSLLSRMLRPVRWCLR